MARGGDEDMGEVLADAVAVRERLDRRSVAGVGGVGVEAHAVAHGGISAWSSASRSPAGRGDLLGEGADRSSDVGERACRGGRSPAGTARPGR